MKKILTTVYISSAILFGQCAVKGAQIENGLAECAETVRTHLKTIKKVMDDDFDASKSHKKLLKEGEIDKEEFDRLEFKAQEDAEVKITNALPGAASAFKDYRNKFFDGKDVDPLKYAKENRDNAYDEYVKLFGEFSGVIQGIIDRKYFWLEDLDEILRKNGASLRSLGLKNCLDLYCVFIASRYLNSIDDHINLIESSAKFQGNLEKFHYNPVSLNKTTREFFPNLQTLYRYSKEDENFDNDSRIMAREVWYTYYCTKEIAPNTTYRRDLILTKEYIQKRFADKKNISIKDWPKINGKVVLDDSCFTDIYSSGAVELPNYITRLGKECFQCKSFCKISLPTSLKAIGASCFLMCNIKEIEVPKSCMVLGTNVFYMCDLTRVVLSEGLRCLPAGGFRGCSALISISIPTKVMSIGEACFYNFSSLSSIEIPPLVTRLKWGTFHSCSSLQDVKLPKNLAVIKGDVFFGCRKLTRLTLPSSLSEIGRVSLEGNGNLSIVNKSPLLLRASILAVKAVENVGLDDLQGLDTEQLILMRKAESALDKLSRLDLLTKPHRINDFKQFVRVAVSNDPTKIDGNATSEINSVRGLLSDLAQLSSLALLARFPELGGLKVLSELSVLSELEGKGNADVN